MNKRLKNPALEGMLQDWYGPGKAEGEMLRFLPQAAPLEKYLSKVIARTLPPWEARLAELRNSWEQVIGPEIARRCTPASLNEGVIYIAVNHPAYRMALDVPQIREKILSAIQERLGKRYCKDLKFVIAGGSARQDR